MGCILTRRPSPNKAARPLKRVPVGADPGEVGSSIGHRSEDEMRRMQVQHRTSRREYDPRPLPLDARDPDILRAKQLRRTDRPVPAKTSR
jgi:hypothetical protein